MPAEQTIPRRGPTAGKRPLSPVAIGVLALAVATALLGMISGFGYQWGFWTYRTGFTLLRYSAYGGIGVVVLSLLVLAYTRPGTSRRGFALALIALVLGLTIVAVPWSQRRTSRSVPPIHDITTDTENPPEFIAIAPLRADAPNPVSYAGEEVAELQRAAYPDIRPLVLDLQREEAFQQALAAVQARGWRLVDSDPATGRIEATDRTRWFGFYDDVTIRLTPLNGRTVLDIRSKSRVGRGDAGTNARRIREFLREIDG